MTHDPERWAVLGQAIRNDRLRQALTHKAVVALVKQRGGSVTERTLVNLENGVPPKKRPKPLALEPVVAALGWKLGWTDRILAGEAPNLVLQRDVVEKSEESPRSQLLELASTVYEFSRMAARLGAPARLRDDFDDMVQRILNSVPAAKAAQSSYGLAAMRPHAEGEGVPADDAARIREALDGDG